MSRTSLGPEVDDEDAAVALAAQQALLEQALHRLADGSAADRELLREGDLGELGARREGAVEDALAQPVRHEDGRALQPQGGQLTRVSHGNSLGARGVYNVDNERIIRHRRRTARRVTGAGDDDFASDNWSGATPAVDGGARPGQRRLRPAYGDDALTARVTRLFCDVFEREVAVFFVASGTAANLLCLQATARPSGFVLCSDQAHIYTDEFNGPEFFTGMKLVPVATADARMTAAALQRDAGGAAARRTSAGPLAALSLTNATEFGTAYAAAEVAELAAIAKAHGAAVHIDGARFANAVAATGDSPADLTWRAGVDLMSFGGTKNGCWAAEAIVVFDPAALPRPDPPPPASRARAQQAALHRGPVRGATSPTAPGWRPRAHANAMAARLAAGLTAARLGPARVAVDRQRGLPGRCRRRPRTRLRAGGATFHTWQERGDEEMVRLVTSFATTEARRRRFLALLPA